MRLARGPWLGQAHVVALSRAPLEGADRAFQDPEHTGSASHSYRLFHLTWSYEDLAREIGASTEIDKQDAAALLALLQWYSKNPEAEQSLLAAAQDQISGDRSGTPDLLFVPDRNGKLRVLPSTALGTADLELVPGRAITATPRITYRATRGFWLPEAAELEQLINDPAVKESDLQKFFEDHPHLLAGTSYDRVVPHPILARDQDGPLIPVLCWSQPKAASPTCSISSCLASP